MSANKLTRIFGLAIIGIGVGQASSSMAFDLSNLNAACLRQRDKLMARQAEVDAAAAGGVSCRNLRTLQKVQRDAGAFFQRCVPTEEGRQVAAAYLDASRKTQQQISDMYAGGC